MKKIFILSYYIIGLSISENISAQNHMISLSSGYEKQSFFSMNDGEISSINNMNWDIAFSIDPYISSIRINDGHGVELYTYEQGDTSSWNSINNSAISNLSSPMYNSDTSWFIGAFDANQLGHPDYGWGTYNMATHYVTGDSLFIIKTLNGDWKKLWIVEMGGGSYKFRYANLDGSNEINQSISKTNYNGKHFVYFSIDQGLTVDREPLNNSWDVTFTKYISMVQGTPYAVTGVLHNAGVKVAKAENISSPFSYVDYSLHSLETEINTIGYNWKTFDMQSFNYILDPNLCYFIKDLSGNIYRLIFTAFEGTSTGNIEFNVENIFSTENQEKTKENFSLLTYPNPTNHDMTLVYDVTKHIDNITITDVLGNTVYEKQVELNGFDTFILPTSLLKKGIYFVSLNRGLHQQMTKTIIRL
tara:strand:+ start:289 stop:1536 length:1248 start_codon:yes stop_codon:yes gene_type:complete